MLTIGGYSADLEPGLRRKYYRRPRPLAVTFETFTDLGVIDAKHFYLRFKEAADPFVGCRCEGRDAHDHQPWDDAKKGDEWRISFISKADATEALFYIERMLEGSRKYTLEVDRETEQRWQDEGWAETLREQEERYSEDLNPYRRPLVHEGD